MCAHGDTVAVSVLVDQRVHHSGVTTRDVRPVDRCIAPIVKALDDAGIHMLGSCCGHGNNPGSILLADGRRLEMS